MSTNLLQRIGLGVAALAITMLAPELGRAQDYECDAPLGASCSATLFDAYYRNTNFNVGQTTSTLIVTPGACDTDDMIVDVDLDLDILHPYIGDLEVTLTHPSGTSTQLLYRPGIGVIDGNCPNDDLKVSFDDDDGAAIGEDDCAHTIPAMAGAIIPFNPLSVFDGKPRNGQWTLTVRDHVPGDQGVLRGWTLHLPCVPDLPDVNLDATDSLVAETGDDDSATITFTRGGDTDAELSVQYVVTGTAALSDFQDLSGTIVIPAGDSSAELTINAIQDDLTELQETIVVSLLAGADYEIGARDTATVTILDETLEPGGQAGQGGDSGEGGEGGDSGEGGASGEAGTGGDEPDSGVDGGTDGDSGDDGCGCKIAGKSEAPSPLALGFALFLTAALIRRRTR